MADMAAKSSRFPNTLENKKSVQDDNDDFNGETIHPPIFQMTSFEVTHFSSKLRFIHGQKSFAHYREPKCIG